MNAVDAAALHPPPAEIRLWEGQAPFFVSNAPPETIESGSDTNRRISHIEVPTLTIYSPPKDKNTGIAAVICPGGGYRILSWDKEGLDVAKWLQERGITGAVLKYRMPAPSLRVRDATGTIRPIVDAGQAIKLLRERANEFGIKTNRIGIIGFSAGGHLAAYTATSCPGICRPDFCVLVYPVITMMTNAHTGSRNNLLGTNSTEQLRYNYSVENFAFLNSSPTFLVAARDDKTVPVTNSIMFAEACERAGVPVEIHLYDQGGHGFGLGVNGGDVTNWPAQMERFLQRLQ
jgi:acetyl esterase/lipase